MNHRQIFGWKSFRKIPATISVQGASPFIYKGLHLALESVAVKYLNIYGTKIWRYKQKDLTLYSENGSEHAFNR